MPLDNITNRIMTYVGTIEISGRLKVVERSIEDILNTDGDPVFFYNSGEINVTILDADYLPLRRVGVDFNKALSLGIINQSDIQTLRNLENKIRQWIIVEHNLENGAQRTINL